jgi:hypothetical protein
MLDQIQHDITITCWFLVIPNSFRDLVFTYEASPYLAAVRQVSMADEEYLWVTKIRSGKEFGES